MVAAMFRTNQLKTDMFCIFLFYLSIFLKDLIHDMQAIKHNMYVLAWRSVSLI